MLDEHRLRHLYLNEAQSIRAIAVLEGVPTRSVYDALMLYRIPRRSAGFNKRSSSIDQLFDEVTLRKLYLDDENSIRAIATMYQISSRKVYDALTQYRIPRRTRGHRRAAPAFVLELSNGTLDHVQLRHLYEQEGQSIAAIAAQYQCTANRIRTALVRWGIARRRRGRQHMIL
jgi:hypothetical protein